MTKQIQDESSRVLIAATWNLTDSVYILKVISWASGFWGQIWLSDNLSGTLYCSPVDNKNLNINEMQNRFQTTTTLPYVESGN